MNTQQLYDAADDIADYASSMLRQDRIDELNRQAKHASAEQDLEDMRYRLRRKFLHAMEFANAPSTPKIPTTYRLNVAEEGAADRFELRIRMQPVTVVAYAMLETKGGADDHLHLLIAAPEHIASQRDAQLNALATDYAEAEAEALVAAEWQE